MQKNQKNAHVDEVSGVSTTGHEWDGIKELNNPLPRWWVNTFYLTIVFAIGYTILYPAWPGLHSATKGIWGWSSRGDVETSMATAAQGHADVEKQIASSDMKAILADDKMKSFATAAGAALFKSNCTACHGSGAQGGIGYPNLNANRWLWGGSPDEILTTITHGARYASDPKTHDSQMPAFGHDGILKPDEITAVANHVMRLTKLPFDAALADKGTKIFADNCAACHGDNGEGKVDFGAPALTSQIWLYNRSLEAVVAQVNNPRMGVMPAWGDKLGPVKVKELAAYIVSLGGAK
jgi:cytochrome c oxidase cbb3-type subunit 3